MTTTVIRAGSSTRVEVTGNEGEDGTSATVAIGTVATGAPGSQVVIINRGTPSAAILDFTIPRGDTGQPRVADLFIVLGQSLTIGRAPQVTAANAVAPTLFEFNGGCEAPGFTSPVPLQAQFLPIDPNNMNSLMGFVPPSGGVETWGPGLGYQSAKTGTPRSFFFAPGLGSMSARSLHNVHIHNLRHGLLRAVRLLRLAGYEPIVRFIYVQGHADADAFDDGNNATTPTSTAGYVLAVRKLFATMRSVATSALGYTFTDPIWVTPLLTQNSVASYAARRDIVTAQLSMPATITGVRLLPPHSQFANLFGSDLVHPLGAGYRYYAELAAAYVYSGLTPPMMISKAVSGSAVVITFDQPVKYMATPDATVPGNSKNGFTVADNTGTEVAVSATSISGSVVTLTVASVANLNGSWVVRNGLQQMSALGSVGFPAQSMPRTVVAGLVDVGTAQDGTVLQNLSVPQEL